jgi:putative membrane protein
MTALLVAAALFAPSDSNAIEAGNPNTKPAQPLKSTTLSERDLHVLSLLHFHDAVETEAGRLAKDQASSKRVKAFGALIAKDDTFLDKQVMKTARKAGVTVPPYLPKDDIERAQFDAMEGTLSQLKALKGPEFDRVLIDAVQRWNQDVITAVEAQRSVTQDAHVYSLLDKVLPVLREHRGMAARLASGKSGV